MLYTLAYPTLAAEHAEFLAELRRKYDATGDAMVRAHFTLVFGCRGVDQPEFHAHVAAIAGRSDEIRFALRYAMLGVDHESPAGYVHLVPDAGFSALARLHDRLYTGPLRSHLRLDLPYVPHITVGRLADRQAAKVLCDELNRDPMRLDGSVRAVTVCWHDGAKVHDLATYRLGSQ